MSTISNATLHRDIGTLEGRMGGLERELSGVKIECASIDAKLDALLAFMNQSKGGRKAFIFMGGLTGTIFGGAAAAVVDWFVKK